MNNEISTETRMSNGTYNIQSFISYFQKKNNEVQKAKINGES